jgi:Flp pilus assembly protein TadG
MASTVIILPVVLLGLWLVLQLALVMHVQHVAEAAAQDAALAAASGAGDPQEVAASIMSASAGTLASGIVVEVVRQAGRVTVTVDADVVGVFPVGSYSAHASASAPIEQFVPQPERP